MNEEILREILEELKFQTAVRNTSSSKPGTETIDIEQLAKRFNRLGNSSDDLDKELLELGYSSKGLNRAQIDQIKSAHEYDKQLKIQNEALKDSFISLKEFGKSLLSTERNFSKYGSSIEGMASAAGKFISVLGPAGKILGPMIEALGKLGKIYLEQADRLLKANDQLAQFGTAGSFTTKELMQMAHGAGIYSKNMELLTKPIASLGPALINLGGTTGEGVKAFANLTKITSEQREEYQRLGISQEQLIQGQADYIQLQRMSGRIISTEAKDRAALQKASLEYTDNLLQLSAISGQDVATLKQKQQLALAENNYMISQMRLKQRADDLRAKGDTASIQEADRIKKEMEMRDKLISGVAANLDDQARLAFTARLATGTFTDASKGLAILGVNMAKHEKKMREGGDATGDVLNEMSDKLKTVGVAQLGQASVFNKELSDTVLTTSKNLQFATAGVKDYNEALNKAKGDIDKATKPGTDPAQDARARLTTMEIEATKALDKLTAAANPLISGFNATTLAATAAAAALGGLASAAGGGLLKGRAGLGQEAIDAARKAAASIPKGATGGIFEGPKEGYLAELHGKEMVIPMNDLGLGKKISELQKQPIQPSKNIPFNIEKNKTDFAKIEGDYEPRENVTFDEEILPKLTDTDEDLDIFGQALKDSENILRKFNTTLTKFNEFEEERLEETEDSFKKIDRAQAGISSTISSAAIDIKNFASKLVNFKPDDGSISAAGTSSAAASSSTSGAGSNRVIGTGFGGIVTSGSNIPVKTGYGEPQTATPEQKTSDIFSKALGQIGSIFGINKEEKRKSEDQAMPSSTVQGLLDFIGKHESGNDYNILVGGKKANLSDMTVEQVMQLQSQMIRMGHESTAVGKYQIINKTLRGILGSSGVQLTDKFNQVTQDKLAMALLKNRGLEQYLAKKIDADTFADNLSMEWASLPYRTGRSYHAGVGSNKSLTQRSELISNLPKEPVSSGTEKIPKAKLGGVFDGPESGYLVEFHGKEMVIPMDKLTNVTQQELSNITKVIEEIPKDDMSGILKDLQTDIKTTLTQLVQNKNDELTTGANINNDLMNSMMTRLDQIIDQLSKSNSTQDKLLQTARV